MKEKLMTPKEIDEEIKYEDSCMVNTLLQNLLYFQSQNKVVDVFRTFNNKGEITGYTIRDKETGEDVQL